MSTHSDGMRFSGSLSDGRSAGAKPVEVSLGDGGLEFHVVEGTPVGAWPYAELRSSVPLHARAADVLLSLQPDGNQTLFVADPAFASQLLGRVPALSLARQRWRGLRPGLTVVGAVLAVALVIRFLELDPAHAVARIMPQQSREALGNEFCRHSCQGPQALRDAGQPRRTRPAHPAPHCRSIEQSHASAGVAARLAARQCAWRRLAARSS